VVVILTPSDRIGDFGMTKMEWEDLEHLGELHAEKKISKIGMDNYTTLLERTMEVDEHPEDYEGPCLCKLCCSYGD
jgi:hypothetical protein